MDPLQEADSLLPAHLPPLCNAPNRSHSKFCHDLLKSGVFGPDKSAVKPHILSRRHLLEPFRNCRTERPHGNSNVTAPAYAEAVTFHFM